MSKRIIVFFDAEHLRYFQILTNCLQDGFTITNIYGIGDVEGLAGDYPVLSLKELNDSVKTDEVIILSNQTDNIRKLVGLLLKNIGSEQIFEFMQVPEVFLTDEGKMLFLEQEINSKFPRLAAPNSMGAFTYYQDLQIYDELQNGRSKCTIGKFCALGPSNVFLLGEEHFTSWGTIYPLNTKYNSMIGNYGNESTFSKGSIEIGNDVWTGYGVTLLSGVTIGDGCVIGARAVVTRSVEPYSIVVGNPGRVVKKRFSDEKIEKLIEMKWWDWSYEDIFKAKNIIQSEKIDELYEYYVEHVKVN